ncbi:MAG: hypothetical protein ABIJ97_12485 [Bacteroidota bacterium]
MRKNSIKFSLIFVAGLVFSISLFSQNNDDSSTSEPKIKVIIGSDIMSRYVWRGCDYGDSPSIQPTLSFSMSNLEVGCWNAIATGSFYKEIDLYAKYTYKILSLMFTDYYIPSVTGTPCSPDIRYFNYVNEETAHTFEGSFILKGGEKLPLWLQGGVFFYGNDKRWGYDVEKDSTDGTYYSSYIEAGYSLALKENNLDLFIGFSPFAGAYANDFGIVNLGITGYRKIKISDDFELPVKASLIFNPQASNAFIIFGITL